MKLSVDIVHHLRPHGPRRSLCRPLIEHKPHQHGTSLTRHAIESRQVHFTLVDYISLPVTPRFFSTEPCSHPGGRSAALSGQLAGLGLVDGLLHHLHHTVAC